MAENFEVLEERLKSFLCHLQGEYAILDRIIYKNKNQHRRCSYFQYLLKVVSSKFTSVLYLLDSCLLISWFLVIILFLYHSYGFQVKRDLKILQSIHMEELLDACFNVISGKKAKQKAHLLESLKRKKCDSGKYNFMQRLLGAARLLSEMVEPMLKAAVEISTLLARSFFMGFSLMVLALLARIRVLVQQMLLDVVSVFNEVSSIAQKKQSIKLNQEGVEVFREYYPSIEEVVTLECVWKTDKFVLVETMHKCETRQQDGVLKGDETVETSVQYQSIDAFLGEDELNPKKAEVDNNGEESVPNIESKRSVSEGNYNPEPVQTSVEPEDVSEGGSSFSISTTSSISSPLKRKSAPEKRVAFISVKKPAVVAAPDASKVVQVDESNSKRENDKENPFFDLFLGETAKGCIFG